MSSLYAFGRIRIISIPCGGAPVEIREKWIGVEMECVYYDPANTTSQNIATGEFQPKHKAYGVLQVQALEALEKVAPEAALWWKKQGYPKHPLAFFTFRAETVEVLEPVQHISIMLANYPSN